MGRTRHWDSCVLEWTVWVNETKLNMDCLVNVLSKKDKSVVLCCIYVNDFVCKIDQCEKRRRCVSFCSL